jgi:hypothetical protein
VGVRFRRKVKLESDPIPLFSSCLVVGADAAIVYSCLDRAQRLFTHQSFDLLPVFVLAPLEWSDGGPFWVRLENIHHTLVANATDPAKPNLAVRSTLKAIGVWSDSAKPDSLTLRTQSLLEQNAQAEKDGRRLGLQPSEVGAALVALACFL